MGATRIGTQFIVICPLSFVYYVKPPFLYQTSSHLNTKFNCYSSLCSINLKNISFFLISPFIFQLFSLFNFSWTQQIFFKPKLTKLIPRFLSFSETNENQLIFIILYFIDDGFDNKLYYLFVLTKDNSIQIYICFSVITVHE